MAYPREVQAYPLALIEAIEAAITQGRRVVLPCTSEREAKGLRLRFYGLRRALLDTIKSAEPHPHAQQAYKVRFVVERAIEQGFDYVLIIEYLEDAEDIQDLSRRISKAIANSEAT